MNSNFDLSCLHVPFSLVSANVVSIFGPMRDPWKCTAFNSKCSTEMRQTMLLYIFGKFFGSPDCANPVAFLLCLTVVICNVYKMGFVLLYCFVLYCIVLYCIVLYYCIYGELSSHHNQHPNDNHANHGAFSLCTSSCTLGLPSQSVASSGKLSRSLVQRVKRLNVLKDVEGSAPLESAGSGPETCI